MCVQFDRALGFDSISSQALVSSCFVTTNVLLIARVLMLLYASILTAHFASDQLHGISLSSHPLPLMNALSCVIVC